MLPVTDTPLTGLHGVTNASCKDHVLPLAVDRLTTAFLRQLRQLLSSTVSNIYIYTSTWTGTTV